MRASRGGWVSNSRLNQPRRSGSGGPTGSPSHRWAVGVPPVPHERPGLLHLLQGGDQRRRIAGQTDRAEIGRLFPLASHDELQAEAGRRAEGEENVAADGPCPSPGGGPGRAAEDAEEGHAHGRYEDVVALDVGQLMGEHAFQLDPVEVLEEAFGDDQGGVAGRTTDGEGVEAGVGDDVETREGGPRH